MIVVGITETCEVLRKFPATVNGYFKAVEYIGTLTNHEDGIYYLDAPEGMAAKAHCTHGVALTRVCHDCERTRQA